MGGIKTKECATDTYFNTETGEKGHKEHTCATTSGHNPGTRETGHKAVVGGNTHGTSNERKASTGYKPGLADDEE